VFMIINSAQYNKQQEEEMIKLGGRKETDTNNDTSC
jgi:hypothetical protein